jgi:isoleucyl-tRNA synthetase
MSELNADKKAAYETLHECLVVTAQLMSPIAPFYGEWLYKNMTDGIREKAIANKTPLASESVHLTKLVAADDTLIDTELSESMHIAQRISSLVHSLRKKERIKVRQPLQKILIPILKDSDKQHILNVEELILSEINVKEIEYVGEDSGVLIKKIKPNFRKLGQHFGAKMKMLTPIINGMSQDEIKQLEKEGAFEIDLDGDKVSLTLEDVEITSEDIPGWLVASEDGLTVALDVTLTDDLKKEGLSRDLVNRIQNLRKDDGLEVQDKINVKVSATEAIVSEAIADYKSYIQKETQAVALEYVKELNDGTELDIDGLIVKLSVEVAK